MESVPVNTELEATAEAADTTDQPNSAVAPLNPGDIVLNVTAPKIKASLTTTLNFGNTLSELAATIGEDKVFELAKATIRVNGGGKARRHLEDGLPPEEVIKIMADWVPFEESGRVLSGVALLKARIAKMSDEDKQALAAQIKDMLQPKA
jgi:hypothetical protein